MVCVVIVISFLLWDKGLIKFMLINLEILFFVWFVIGFL